MKSSLDGNWYLLRFLKEINVSEQKLEHILSYIHWWLHMSCRNLPTKLASDVQLFVKKDLRKKGVESFKLWQPHTQRTSSRGTWKCSSTLRIPISSYTLAWLSGRFIEDDNLRVRRGQTNFSSSENPSWCAPLVLHLLAQTHPLLFLFRVPTLPQRDSVVYCSAAVFSLINSHRSVVQQVLLEPVTEGWLQGSY